MTAYTKDTVYVSEACIPIYNMNNAGLNTFN